MANGAVHLSTMRHFPHSIILWSLELYRGCCHHWDLVLASVPWRLNNAQGTECNLANPCRAAGSDSVSGLILNFPLQGVTLQAFPGAEYLSLASWAPCLGLDAGPPLLFVLPH